MSHEQNLHRFTPYSPAVDRRADIAPEADARARPRLLTALWRARVAVAGTLAIALAVAGEWLMRLPAAEQDPAKPWLTVGTALMVAAVVLVVPVAWVWDSRPRRNATAEALPPTGSSLPVRKHTAPTTPRGQIMPTMRVRARHVFDRLIALRRRAGRLATAMGMALVGGMAVALFLLIRADFASPWAPWLWLAMLAVLALTFAGVRPRVVERFVPHDPAEPAAEPPVRRAEWAAIGVIMLVALLARFINLDSIPVGPYVDESGRALVARQIIAGQPIEGLPFTVFGTAWWGVSNLYFWLESVSMRLFGDNLLGARFVHALAGLATVWFVYRLVRLAWSPRAALVAAALAAVSDFAVQFSRTAGESTIAILTWTVCFYYLYRGIKFQRPLDFVWSGIAAGLTLYTYGSGKLLPIFVALACAYLVVRWRLRGARRFVPLSILLAIAAGLTFLPHATFLVTQKPDAFTQRSSGVAIWEERHKPGLLALYGTDNWLLALPRQVAVTYAAFDVGEERGPFYPTQQPVLPIPWAALWVLGTAYWVFRAGDVRYATLGIWVASGLAGAFLTNDTPTLQRAAGMVPTLAVVPALFLDRVASGFVTPRFAIRAPRRARVVRWAAGGVIALGVALLGWQTLSFYFGQYAPRQVYLNPTIAGRYIGKQDPATNLVLTYNIPHFLGDPSPTIFLAGNVPMAEFNPSERIPVVAPRGAAVRFLVHPPESALLPILRAYYPGGKATALLGEGNLPYMVAYEVDAAALATTQSVVARYGEVVRPEPRVGTLGDSEEAIQPPPWVQYPARAEWSGNFIVPAFARHFMSVEAPAGATLTIDGREVLAVQPGTVDPVLADLVLAKGVHSIVLSGTLDSPQGTVALRWGDGNEMVPLGRRFLWSGPSGALSSVSYTDSATGWLVTEPYDPQGQQLAMARRDGFISFLSANQNLGYGSFVFTQWRGTLVAPVAGDYSFDAVGNGMFTLWIDGKLVGGRSLDVTTTPLPVTLPLGAGEHAFELRWRAGGDNSPAELRWQPPGGQWVIMPPTAFAPAGGGVWTSSEVLAAPGTLMSNLYP